jgi:RNA polymerase sigma-70 factor (ECF subfamily)
MTTNNTIKRRRTRRARDLSQASDEQLLLHYRDKSDAASFEALVHRYERELYSYLRRYLGDAELAEDVFQTTFLQVHQKCDQFQDGRSFRPWLYTIATHQAIDALRKRHRHPTVSFDAQPTMGEEEEVDRGTYLQLLTNHAPGPVAQLEEKERREWVRRAVQELPLTLRSAVLLVYYQGLKYRDVAEILGIPEGTLKSRIHAALVKLNQAWRQKEHLEEGEQPCTTN